MIALQVVLSSCSLYVGHFDLLTNSADTGEDWYTVLPVFAPGKLYADTDEDWYTVLSVFASGKLCALR